MIQRQRFHRAVFLCAGMYNIAWAVLAALAPQWLYRFAGMPDGRYPEIFSCMGMILGCYGLLYCEAARVPERGWAIAAVGLLGKVLGPIGLGCLVLSGHWPPATILLILTNDLIWWIPFGLYLYDAWPMWRKTWSNAE